MGDMTAHGGSVQLGATNVLIGESMPGAPASPVVPAVSAALSSTMNALPPDQQPKAAAVLAFNNAAVAGDDMIPVDPPVIPETGDDMM
jgi:hypothetical protein